MPWSIGFSTILSAFCVTGHRLQVKASAYVPTMIILNTSSVSALAGQARQSYRTSFIPTIIYIFMQSIQYLMGQPREKIISNCFN